MHVFGEWKNFCSSKFLQLEAKKIKKPCSLRFSLKFFWTLLKNTHCQGPCSLRPCILRPYCIGNENSQIFRPSVGSVKYMSVWSEVGESNFLEASSPQPIQHSAKVFQTHFCKNRAWKFNTLIFS